MLQVQRLSKSYGAAVVLSNVNFVLDDGEHVGLVGPNGAGKSTLFRCIVGQESADAGSEWLEGFVQRYRGTVFVVSHDREFLDRTVTRILYLDPASRSVRSYPGNYSAFAAARVHEREIQAQTWKTEQEYVERASADIA